MEVSTNDRLLTIKEAAKILKVHWQTIRNYIKRGYLESIKIGRSIRIRESDIKEFISKRNENSEDKVEIEIRFIIKNRRELEKRLIDKGSEVVYHGHVIDHWFVPKSIKSMEQQEVLYDTCKGFGLRIREQDNGYTGKITTSVEVKRLVIPFKHDTCLEHEIDISNYEEAKRLLELMDFKENITIDKDRIVYQYKEFKVVIDTIKNFKTGVEIEVITNKDREEVIPKLEEAARELQLDPTKDITSKSLTYMAIKERAKF